MVSKNCVANGLSKFDLPITEQFPKGPHICVCNAMCCLYVLTCCIVSDNTNATLGDEDSTSKYICWVHENLVCKADIYLTAVCCKK